MAPPLQSIPLRQIAEDTCCAHSVFCCPECFDMEPAVRELDKRLHDGLEISLLWEPSTNSIAVQVADRRADVCEVSSVLVPRAAAQDAFEHPFRYLP